MDIIIAGAGKVGFKLAQTLSIKHNVTIIDRNKDALQRLQESIDILPIIGDIENPEVYKPLDGSYDIFIAVTDNDEANILSTLIADDEIDVAKKIIRLRNPYFAKSSIAKKLSIDAAVFPFSLTARSVGALLDFPKANNVKEFIFTPLRLISVRVNEPLYKRVDEFQSDKLKAVGIERSKKFFLPAADERLENGDLLYLFGEMEQIKQICAKINKSDPKEIKKAAIFGADLLGLEIAKIFLEKGIVLKIIESDPERCKRASEVLQDRATIINSKYIEHDIYEEENIRFADMVVATSSDDEVNIIECLQAGEYGVKKRVAINNDLAFYDLMHKLQIVAIRGPKASAYYAILEKIASSNIVTEKHYCGGRGAVFMRKIFSDSTLVHKVVKPLRLEGITIFYIRNEQIYNFDKKLRLQAEDIIVVFLQSYQEEKVKKWIFNL